MSQPPNVAAPSPMEGNGAYNRNWRTFLGHRSREMRTGARLVVLTMAREDNGDFGYGPVLRVLYAELMARVADGLLRADEVHRMVIPTVGRTRAEFAAPFAGGGPFAGLSIGLLEVFCRASVFPTLTAQLDGGRTDPRAGRFFAEMEAGMAARLAGAPERMRIPLEIIVLVKNG